MCTGYEWGNLREGEHLKDPSVNGRIILNWIFEKWDGNRGLDRSGTGLEQVAGCCECGSEPSDCTNWWGFLDELSTC